MPPEPVDFNGLMADVVKMQQMLAQIHGSLTQPKQKEVMGELLDKIQKARVDAETAYPAAEKTIRESAERTLREAEVQKQECAARRQAIAELAARQGKQPAPAKHTIRRPALKTLQPLTTEPGSLLRKELLQRFGGAASRKAQTDDRDIWEDWNWE